MALQTSGAISINDLATEFGGTAPHSLSEYYRGGGLVPDTGTNSGIPSSGQIQLDDFYGAAAYTPVQGKWYSWGHNKFGALARPSTTVADPVVAQVGSDTNWHHFAVGEGRGTGVKTDGKLWSWSQDNLLRQLGYPGGANLSSPVQFSTGTDWTAGGGVDYRVKSNNTLWKWGEFVGDGTSNIYSSPVQIGGAEWSIEPDSGSTVARGDATHHIRTDGRLWSWGVNTYGDVNDGTTTTRLSPVQVSGNYTDWVKVGTGTFSFHTAMRSNGTIYQWGWLGSVYSSLQNSAILGTYTDLGNQVGVRSDGKLWYFMGNYPGNGTSLTASFIGSSPIQIGSSTDCSNS